MMKQLVFMTEEASMEKFVEITLEKLLPENIVYVMIEEDLDNGSRIITFKQGI